ncbi:sensor histidine kinase [Schumannella luteola]
MRVAVLPRDVAARVITGAAARSFGAVNAATFALSIPMLAEYAATWQLGPVAVVPYVVLVVLLAVATVMTIRPSRRVLALFLVLGTLGALVFQVSLVTARPEVLHEALYLYNRPATALVLAGVTASTVRAGILWALGGFGLSTLVTAATAVITGTPFTAGYGPVLTLLLVVVVYGAFGLIQVSLRRRVPDLDVLEEQTRRGAYTEGLRDRITATVHDTLLNDLALVMNAPDTLDERMLARLREDLDTLSSADWLRESADTVVDEQDSQMRNRISTLLSDLQWRGLTVRVTGSGNGIYRLAAGVPEVLIDVLRACLENVLQHAGTSVAELDLGGTEEEITFVVSDQGVGFDPEAIADDRLGLRHSVVERIRAVGGSTKIWSTPGAGTSIVVRVPVLGRVTPHEESRHGDS